VPLPPPETRADSNTATRIEILKSAAIAFRRLGYHGATVEQIAASLDMQKGNLYYYFRNKEEILFGCHLYSLDRVLALLAEIEDSDVDPETKVRRIVVSFVHLILDELHGTALFLTLEALTPEHRAQAIERRDEFDRGLRRIIQQGIDRGDFGAVNAKLLSFAILGAINWIPRWYRDEGPCTTQEIADHFADFFIQGLRPK
jgi:AcrR family transcriptional regulator